MCKKHKLRLDSIDNKKVRGTGKIPDDAFTKAESQAKGRAEAETQRERMKLVYPSWANLDAGTIELFATDAEDWIKVVIKNHDYPGVCILKTDTLLKALVSYKKQMQERFAQRKDIDK